jgi:hypothetical protein
VPFYFQPTLGGSDINGNQLLGSYQDYRFRGPNLMFLRGNFEHSLKNGLHFIARVDYGKVALARGDLDLSHLRHSFTTGLTYRAGDFPELILAFSWGGREGTHSVATMSPTLLNSSPRPSLY